MLSSSDAVYSHFRNCDILLQLEKKYGLTRIYMRCRHDAPLKRTGYFQHTLLRWITGKDLNFDYSWLNFQLFSLLLFFKCMGI